MGKVMEQLDIADAMAKKVILKPALDGGVQLVAAGQAEIGIYPTSEVAGVKGLTIVGPLPPGINLEIVYGAAATTDSAAPNAAAPALRRNARRPTARSLMSHVMTRRVYRRVIATRAGFRSERAS